MKTDGNCLKSNLHPPFVNICHPSSLKHVLLNQTNHPYLVLQWMTVVLTQTGEAGFLCFFSNQHWWLSTVSVALVSAANQPSFARIVLGLISPRTAPWTGTGWSKKPRGWSVYCWWEDDCVGVGDVLSEFLVLTLLPAQYFFPPLLFCFPFFVDIEVISV